MPKKKVLICIKYFLEKNFFQVTILWKKKQEKKKNIPTTFLQQPHPKPPKE
jgi:hypothetical protein